MENQTNSNNRGKLDELLRHLPAFVFHYDFNPATDKACFPYVSHGITTYLGLQPEDVKEDASPVFNAVHPEDLPVVQQSMRHSAGTMENWNCAFRIKDAHGNYQWMEGVGKPVKKSDAKIRGYGLITPSQDHLKALKESEEKLQSLNELHSLINNFSSALMQTDVHELHDAIEHTLAQLGEYAGVDRVYIFEHEPTEDVVNNTFEWCNEGINPEIDNLQGIPFDAVPRWRARFDKNEHVYIPLVSEIADEYHVEKQILEPQGIISLLAIPMYYGENFIGFIGFDSVKKKRIWSQEHIALLRLAGEIIAGSIFREHFEKQIIEARRIAEEANKAKSEFLANMSHEIRTPMNAILGFSEILLNTIGDEKNRNYLNTVLSSGRTLLSLINDILDLSKIEAGHMEIASEPVQLSVVFKEIHHIFHGRIEEKNLKFKIEIHEDLPDVVVMDDVRLRQILFNLVGNAIKFTPKGTVTLSALSKPNNDQVSNIDLEIKVSDTGIGIDPAYHQKIFNSFYQIESDNTRKYGGTGLGLSITQKLAHILGGSIRVESEVGKGSCFIIDFKNIGTAAYKPEALESFNWIDKEVKFKNARLLIVDDVDFNRELVKSFLADFNLIMLEAHNGKTGVELARMHLPDLILMDLRMPEMNGYEATEILSNLPETSHIPVVAFTASSMKHDEGLIRKLFKDYLRKPIGRNELISCLIRFLPHEIIPQDQKGITDELKQQPFVLDALEQKKLLGFADEFDAQYKEKLASLKDFLDAELLTSFLTDFGFLCRQYSVSHFDGLMDALKQDARNFDFDGFLNHIEQLDANIERFKQQIKS